MGDVDPQRQQCKGREGNFWLEWAWKELPSMKPLGQFSVPSPFAAEFPKRGVRLELSVMDEQVQCDALLRLADAPPLTAQRLRLPFDALISDALRFCTFEFVRRKAGEHESPDLAMAFHGQEPDAAGYVGVWLPVRWRGATLEAETVHRRRRAVGRKHRTAVEPHNDEFYRSIAELYLSTPGRNPRVSVAKAKNYAPDTVSKWIRRCVELGYLDNGGQGRRHRRGQNLPALPTTK